MFIPYSSDKFPGHLGVNFQGQNTLACTWTDINWAAVTVGKANWSHVTQFGIYSIFERIYRTYLNYSNLTQSNNNHISHSNAFNFLDPSEKGAFSYFLGLTSAKLMAEKYLNIPWLMHLDVYRNQLNPVLTSGKAKPDLVGYDINGNWITIEAKGRSGRFDSKIFNKAKNQAKNLVRIAGNPLLLQIALECHFQRGFLEICWEDPEDSSMEGYELDISLNDFLSDYYNPFIKLVHVKKHYSKIININDNEFEFIIVNFKDIDIKIGIYNELIDHNYSSIKDNAKQFMAYSKKNENSKIGIDGVFIELGNSWIEEKMKKEPHKRN